MCRTKEIVWEIIPNTAPFYLRNCSKCKKKSKFYCSNFFRVNANQKKIDVWLIYRCVNCDKTLNIEIFSRINPKEIDKSLYEKMLKNDVEMAMQYAFDRNIIQKNSLVVDYSSIEWTVKGEALSINKILGWDIDRLELDIYMKYDLNLKLEKLLRLQLNISQRVLDKFICESVISFEENINIKKYRLKTNTKVYVDCIRLREFLNQYE